MKSVEFVNTLSHHAKPVGFPKLIAPGARYVAEGDEQIDAADECPGQERADTKAADAAERGPQSPQEGDRKGSQVARREAVGAHSALAKPITTGRDPETGEPTSGTIETTDLGSDAPTYSADELEAMKVGDLAKLAEQHDVEVEGTGKDGRIVKGDYVKALSNDGGDDA